MNAIEPALFELFRDEVRAHAAALSAGLLELETDAADLARIEPLMRAAHSIKGAARIVGIDSAVRLAHGVEDVLVAAQAGRVRFAATDIDALLQAADVLASLGAMASGDAIASWQTEHREAASRLEPVFQSLAAGRVAALVSIIEQPVPVAIAPPIQAALGISSEPIVLGPDHVMLDLFREELRANLLIVAAAIETGPFDDAREALRQLRGSARIVKCAPIEALSAAMRDRLGVPAAADSLRQAVEVLAGAIATDADSFAPWLDSAAPALGQLIAALERTRPMPEPVTPEPIKPVAEPVPLPSIAPSPIATQDGVVRVTAQSLNRLMGLAGESLVQARWLNVFSTAFGKLKKQHEHLAEMLDSSLQAAATGLSSDQIAALVAETRQQASRCREQLAESGLEFDDHAARAEDLNSRLYREIIASRMRPFSDGLHGLARTVRDMARSLGKQARLEVIGEATEVDRDVLEKLEAPLAHLVRNAVDHGIDTPAKRAAAGKPPVGTIRVEAWHRAGMLSVAIADDGRGIDLDELRRTIVERGHSSLELVRQMNEAELLEFLFLPGFSTAASVTEYSGRGVGLDVVQDTVRRIGGSVRVATKLGEGTTFHLQLPITLSVIRAVVVEVGGEPYAFPHTRIDRLLRVPRAEVHSLEHRQFVAVDGQNVGLVLAGQLLDVPADPPRLDEMPVVLLSDASGMYGLVVDAFRGEQDLVVRPLDPRLGKVPNLSAAAVLDDGEPVLILDVEDLVRSMDTFIQTGALRRCEVRDIGAVRKKRVLVVDDSITVREVERQLLLH
ncbi:MAG TPA: chemotaxis protein CheA, partial [Urbifossiella sp.]|nr:chemotaxis protein CheA [Urbifossiella sp.]